MHIRKAGLGLALISGLALAVQAPAVATAAPAKKAQEPRLATPSDALPNPAAEKQSALRERAWADVLSGEATPRQINGNTVVTGHVNNDGVADFTLIIADGGITASQYTNNEFLL